MGPLFLARICGQISVGGKEMILQVVREILHKRNTIILIVKSVFRKLTIKKVRNAPSYRKMLFAGQTLELININGHNEF